MGLLQTGIGLRAELKAAKKEKKAVEFSATVKEISSPPAAAEQPEEAPPLFEQLRISEKAALAEDELSDDDEHFGGSELPTYQRNAVEPEPLDMDDESPPPYTEEELAERMSMMNFPPPPSFSEAPPRLQCPVIIPQRRPGMKIRGFVRAYAPVLADHDVSQATFLKFLKDFHVASQASPILNVITVGAGTLGNVPEPGSIAVGLTLALVSGTAAEMQSRRRANTYLDRANERLFKPRGLYALVMSFRPDDVPKGEAALETVDTSKHALNWLDKSTTRAKSEKSKYRTNSGITRGELELPETAALIYPDTGNVEIGRTISEEPAPKDAKKEGSKESKPSNPYSARKVTQNYFDKRAQAKYAYKHPGSQLATETQPQFASKYGDPTNPLVTEGYTGRLASAIKKESLEERQTRKRAKAMQSRATIKRLLPNSVLYLMIVNLPSEAELEEAREIKARMPKRVDSAASGSSSIYSSESGPSPGVETESVLDNRAVEARTQAFMSIR